MSNLWSPRVHELKPYVPGEQPKMARLVKLNTNEHPMPPSPKVVAAITQAATDSLQLYPDPESTELRQTLADYYQLSIDEVFVGNGSDEVLAHAFQAFFQQDKPLLFPDISYSFYPVYCGLYQVTPKQVPLDENLAIRLQDYEQANGGIIFPNPNAPTGQLLPLEAIEKLLQKNTQSVVLVDEAYIDFGGESAAKLVPKYPNLLVVQTLSKSRSLAGLRVGFALGQQHLIDALVRVKDSFNSYPLDRLAQAGAKAAFEDEAYFQVGRTAIIKERERLTQALIGLGFNVLPSAANFVFASHKGQAAAALALGLREQGIIVRHFKQPEKIANYLRITVGTSEQTDALLAGLQSLL